MYIVRKEIGETPLACVQRLFPDKKKKYTYAGRLDPMAEGLLLVLEGEECKDAKKYFDEEKTYKYSFAVGIATDTYDCLGRIVKHAHINENIRGKVHEAIQKLNGDITLPYPPYSSKTVNGVPLFAHARNNTLQKILLPERIMKINEHILTDEEISTVNIVRKKVTRDIKLVRGDFRQEEICADWRTVGDRSIRVFSAVLRGNAGVYIRAVVNEIGRQIGYPTVTTAIRRTKIGRWTQSDVYGQ